MLTGDMLRRATARFPGKSAIIWEGRHTSYADLNADANRFAHALAGLGLKKGEKVGIISRNRTEYGIVFFGAAKSGCVLVNVSVLYAPDELEYVLDKADVQVLIYEDLFAEKIEAVKPNCPKIETYIPIGQPFDDFIAGHSADEPDVEIDERDPFSMTYTGGTTGLPKGVLASHLARAVTAHTVMVEEKIDERDIVGIVTPLFHIAALNIMFQPAILAGATVTLLSKWEPADFAKMVRDTGMTANFMVPTQAGMVVQDPGFDPADYATWRKVSFAGAPMPDWVQRDFFEKLPKVKLTQIYGQSEMGVIAVLPHWHLPERLGSVGRPAYNVDIACVHPDGTPIQPGEIGELVSKGDNLMTEYYGEPEQTANFFKLGNGWAWSGDLATVDEEGFYTLIDRSKDMIISGGENIYPKEIEDALYEHDAVAECAVFGIPEDKFGEVPAAYILLKVGMTATEDEIVEHCATRLARFKRPRLVKFVDDFPKTPIGKIQKNFLKDPYWAEQEKKI
ncbi:MAG: acyl-CoA synthetase (AMP-forming)/AMP-acid ligase II [Paracoccaceae bacterium]|jgi:acyl-CoA synthetase (AMP-forming)/AMP-acid ligase II